MVEGLPIRSKTLGLIPSTMKQRQAKIYLPRMWLTFLIDSTSQYEENCHFFKCPNFQPMSMVFLSTYLSFNLFHQYLVIHRDLLPIFQNYFQGLCVVDAIIIGIDFLVFLFFCFLVFKNTTHICILILESQIFLNL